MTSKMLYVAGMKTESEFDDVYLDFIRKYGIPSALRRDNAKSECLDGLKLFAKKTFKFRNEILNVGLF
jgi:hypothetical protein